MQRSLGVVSEYRLRLERSRWQIRAIRKRREPTVISNRTSDIREHDIVAFLTIRNERPRLRYFLNYYHRLGVDHFCFVDNGLTNSGPDLLTDELDVSLWHTHASCRDYVFVGFREWTPPV